MTDASSPLPAPNLMPLMRYRDLAEAMIWLERAFGFEKQIAVSDNDGAAIYGQMTYRGSLMMMGAVRDTDLDKLMRQPDEVGDVETQSCYIVVEDADAHYARAVEAGAEIVLEIKSDGLGRRGYSCRDPQGHIWNFGTYNPAKGLAPVAAVACDAAPYVSVDTPSAASRFRTPLATAAALLLAVGAGTWLFADSIKTDLAQRFAQEQTAEAEAAYAELAKVRAEKRAADAKVAELNQKLEAASGARRADDSAALQAEMARAEKAEAEKSEAENVLAKAESARRDAEAEVAALKAELDRERVAAKTASAQRQSEEADAKQAGLAAKRLQDELAETRSARLKAEAETVTLKAELERQQIALDTANEAKRISEEKLAVQTATATAAEALAHKMAQTAARADAAPPPAAPSPAVEAFAQTAVPATPPGGAHDIETSATGPATTAANAPDDAKAVPRPRKAGKRTARRNTFRRAAAARADQTHPPTYVVNLRDVPWPYSAWYK